MLTARRRRSAGQEEMSPLSRPALHVLLVILAVFGAGGLALHALWLVAVAAVALWGVLYLPEVAGDSRWRWHRR
jgi:hypothetical protein